MGTFPEGQGDVRHPRLRKTIVKSLFQPWARVGAGIIAQGGSWNASERVRILKSWPPNPPISQSDLSIPIHKMGVAVEAWCLRALSAPTFSWWSQDGFEQEAWIWLQAWLDPGADVLSCGPFSPANFVWFLHHHFHPQGVSNLTEAKVTISTSSIHHTNYTPNEKTDTQTHSWRYPGSFSFPHV